MAWDSSLRAPSRRAVALTSPWLRDEPVISGVISAPNPTHSNLALNVIISNDQSTPVDHGAMQFPPKNHALPHPSSLPLVQGNISKDINTSSSDKVMAYQVKVLGPRDDFDTHMLTEEDDRPIVNSEVSKPPRIVPITPKFSDNFVLDGAPLSLSASSTKQASRL
ncbi:hypothetical protein V6N13_051114 [Hibiscus sabdariffa]|uniref:Uncharacterized protein n=1 Tax=Hibiscus sabdariffa TaxID=183260 RepID=A0ABR2T3F9_9ROSI